MNLVNLITNPPSIMTILDGEFTLKCEICEWLDENRNGAMERLRSHFSKEHSRQSAPLSEAG